MVKIYQYDSGFFFITGKKNFTRWKYSLIATLSVQKCIVCTTAQFLIKIRRQAQRHGSKHVMKKSTLPKVNITTISAVIC
jgi:hypothetical protein